MSASHLPFGFVGVHNRVVGNKSMGIPVLFYVEIELQNSMFFPES